MFEYVCVSQVNIRRSAYHNNPFIIFGQSEEQYLSHTAEVKMFERQFH